MTDATDSPPTWPETIARAGARIVPTNIGAGLHIVAEDVVARRRARLKQTATELAEAVGEDALRDRVAADPQIEALVAQVLEASLDAADERKRRALTRVAVNALIDDAVIDESQLVLMALRQLEAPHIRVIVKMAAVYRRHGGASGHPAMAETTAVINAAPRAVMAALTSVGAVRQLPIPNVDYAYHISDLGLRIVDELSADK